MRTERLAVGLTSMGVGMIAFPVALAVYTGLAWLAVAAMTACVGAGNWICAGGPLLLGPIALGLAGFSLLAVIGTFALLLVAGATLVPSRALYVGASLALSVVTGAAGAFFLVRAHAATVSSVESPAFEAQLVDLALGAPLAAMALTLVVAGVLRPLVGALLNRTYAAVERPAPERGAGAPDSR